MDIANKDIRWIQPLNNFQKAIKSLADDVGLAQQRDLTDIEKRGLIQAFEYCYELSWNLIKDFFEMEGEANIMGSRDAFKMAFNRGLIDVNLVDTIKSRQITSHAYNEQVANEIYNKVINKHYGDFQILLESFLKEKEKRKL